MIGDGKGAGMLPQEITHYFAAELMCWEEGQILYHLSFVSLLLECPTPLPHRSYN